MTESGSGVTYRISIAVIVSGFVAGAVACDSSSPDARDLINRVEIASNGYDDIQIYSLNTIVVVDDVQQLSLFPVKNGTIGTESVAESGIWISRNPGVATVDSSGLVTGVADGSVVIDSKFGPLTASTALEVSSAQLTSIEIEPSTASIDACRSVQFVARGVYAANNGATRNITDEVNWGVETESTAGYFSDTDPNGLLRSSQAGSVTVIVSRSGVANVQAAVTVNDTLNSIEIPESTTTLTVARSVQYEARGFYEGDAEGTSVDITNNSSWIVSNTAIATVGNTLPSKGLLDASNNGSVTMTATCGGHQGQLTVLAGESDVISRVQIEGSNPLTFDYQAPETRSLKSFATLQNGVRVEITEDSDWSVIAPGNTNFVLNNNTGFKGQLAINGRGEIEVEVKYSGDDYRLPTDVTLNIPRLKIEAR